MRYDSRLTHYSYKWISVRKLTGHMSCFPTNQA
jgi:hypothetical protein